MGHVEASIPLRFNLVEIRDVGKDAGTPAVFGVYDMSFQDNRDLKVSGANVQK